MKPIPRDWEKYIVRNTFTSEVNYLLADTSLDFYSHIQKDLKFNLDLEFLGYLWLLTEPQYQNFRGLEKSMTDRGIQFKKWGIEDLQERINGLSSQFDSDDDEARALGPRISQWGCRASNVEPLTLSL